MLPMLINAFPTDRGLAWKETLDPPAKFQFQRLKSVLIGRGSSSPLDNWIISLLKEHYKRP